MSAGSEKTNPSTSDCAALFTISRHIRQLGCNRLFGSETNTLHWRSWAYLMPFRIPPLSQAEQPIRSVWILSLTQSAPLSTAARSSTRLFVEHINASAMQGSAYFSEKSRVDNFVMARLLACDCSMSSAGMRGLYPGNKRRPHAKRGVALLAGAKAGATRKSPFRSRKAGIQWPAPPPILDSIELIGGGCKTQSAAGALSVASICNAAIAVEQLAQAEYRR
jgi:hypothetical protein